MSPRVFRVVALPTPTERQKSQLYFQRYIEQLPSGGEIVLFDRSWYNRGGVERVMGFCSDREYQEFLRICPDMELAFIRSDIILLKYFLDVSAKQQERRFHARIHDPIRQWKLSPMDTESYKRWWDYTKAWDAVIGATDTRHAPWFVVNSDDKRRARLNLIRHLLSRIPYKKQKRTLVTLPKRQKRKPSVPRVISFKHSVPALY